MIKGKRLPRIRPPVAGQTTPVYIKRLSTYDRYSNQEYIPHTNYDFVNQIMKKLKTNNANDILHSVPETVPQDSIFVSKNQDQSTRRSSSFSPQSTFPHPAGKRASSKYLSLKEPFAPLINKFDKQKREMQVVNKIQNFMHSFLNITYSFMGIEKKYPEIGQFNNYYEHLLEGQNYDEKDMQSILVNLEKLLLQDKANHQLHNTVFNNEFNHANEELIEAIKSFNIFNSS